jgi:hypothetical protein
MGLKRSFVVAILMTLTGASAAFAQLAKPPVAALTQARIGQDVAQDQVRVIQFANEEAITTSFVQAPSLGSTSGQGGGDNTNWLKVEFHYSVNPPDEKYPWVDSAQFKIWIEGRDLYSAKSPGPEGVAVVLTGALTYTNLPKTRDEYGVFYVHPNVLSRYCGTGTYEDFDRKFNIHVEAWVGGKEVDYFDKKKDVPNWWTVVNNVGPIPVPNLVCRQDQTPFLMADTVRYPQIKLPSSDAAAGSGTGQ